jgi:ribosomal protein S21
MKPKFTPRDSDYYKPVEVRVGDFASFEKAVRKFRKIVEKEGTLKKVVERKRGHVKKSQKRHNQKKRAEYFRKLEKKKQYAR